MSNQLCQIDCLPEDGCLLLLRPGRKGEWNIVSPQGDRAESIFCQDIVPPLLSGLLSLCSRYGQSPPHLDPEETVEKKETQGFSSDLMDCSTHEETMSRFF
ncbi:Hypothetical predicted protein [Xyrichtys novacula]|uniref:Uncharacterized protein n=1 Tax=Xyrichtys novacula TaxID=13765 RepID=A0AAV1F9C4_XYRNO|nr:Hypothetical predicted protein [Xyrichtys novacula]